MTSPSYFLPLALFSIALAPISAITGTIPFQLNGKFIVVQATVGGKAGNFILDTGTPTLLLNARYYDGEPVDRAFRDISGQTVQVAVTYPAVLIGDHRWKSIYAEVINLQGLEKVLNMAIHGLLGMNLFRHRNLTIDFQKREITLSDKHEKPEILSAVPPDAVLPLRYKGLLPMIEARIGNQALQLVVDTGAEINLMDKDLINPLKQSLTVNARQTFSGSQRRRQQVTIADVTDLQLGPVSCSPMKTGFIDLGAINRGLGGPTADGILGYELLSQFRLTFAFHDKVLCLWKIPEAAIAGKKRP